ncbi:DUF2846 domain-containing protein [Cupriavidus nantongensis]
MKRVARMLVAGLAASSLLAGCASGVKHADMAASIPTLKPGGFFFVDRPAGKYVASAATETEKTLSFALDAGETKYVRSSPSMGLMMGRVVLELETPEKAQAELPSLSYTGDLIKTPAK